MYLKVGILSSQGNSGFSISDLNFKSLFTGVAVGATGVLIYSAIQTKPKRKKK